MTPYEFFIWSTGWVFAGVGIIGALVVSVILVIFLICVVVAMISDL